MGDSIRVLHIEDDFADAMLLQHALFDAGGLDVKLEVARTLVDARYMLARRKYDLVVADLRLPDSTDPVETVAMIERHASDTPMLVLTGSALIDADRIAPHITLLDKNDFFHGRDEEKSRALLDHVRDAAEDTLHL